MPELRSEAGPSDPEGRQAIRENVRRLCKKFPDEYWRAVDKAEEYPAAFVDALTASGYLAALIPDAYGGSGLGLTEASIILEEINRSGGSAGACHAQMYTMGTLLRWGATTKSAGTCRGSRAASSGSRPLP